MQLTALLRSYEVSAGRRGCCNYVLYCRPALLNCGAKAAYDLAGPGLLRQPGAKDLKDSADLNYAGAQSGHATLRACQISRGEEPKFNLAAGMGRNGIGALFSTPRQRDRVQAGIKAEQLFKQPHQHPSRCVGPADRAVPGSDCHRPAQAGV
jgi:hypothetical protein